MSGYRRYLNALLLGCLLSACTPASSSPEAVQKPMGVTPLTDAKNAVADVCTDALAAIMAPLEDLNLRRQEIPSELSRCALNPYEMPLPPLCWNIEAELVKLDVLLGPDMEPAPLPWLEAARDKEYLRRGAKAGADFAHQQAVGMVRSKMDIIPFRGAVRRVSGAEKHSREVARAYEAGKLRRAFLKGLRAAHQCSPDVLSQPHPLSQ